MPNGNLTVGHDIYEQILLEVLLLGMTRFLVILMHDKPISLDIQFINGLVLREIDVEHQKILAKLHLTNVIMIQQIILGCVLWIIQMMLLSAKQQLQLHMIGILEFQIGVVTRN